MKAVLFIFMMTLLPKARGSDIITNEWGMVSNGVQLSIALEGGNREVQKNEEVKLLVQMIGLQATNTWTSFALASNTQPGIGLHCVILSPSGKTISPNVKSKGGSLFTFDLSSGNIEKITFDLSRIFKFDEVGTYKITAQKTVFQGSEVSAKSWTVVSNPLLVKVVPAK